MSTVLAGQGGADRIREAVELLASPGEAFRDRRRVILSVLGPLYLRESGTGRTLVGQAMRGEPRPRGAGRPAGAAVPHRP
jgi:hypothetical protein